MNKPTPILYTNPYEIREKTDDWIEPLDSLLDWEKKNRLIFSHNQYYLPKGTILYHGSLDVEFSNARKIFYNTFDKITFFGLDFEISAWFVLELAKIKSKHRGYIHVFETTKDLSVKIIDDLYVHPKTWFSKKCIKNICFHPQLAFRGRVMDPADFYEMFIEVTINLNREPESIEQVDIWEIDVDILEENKKILEFDPKNAIVRSIPILLGT